MKSFERQIFFGVLLLFAIYLGILNVKIALLENQLKNQRVEVK